MRTMIMLVAVAALAVPLGAAANRRRAPRPLPQAQAEALVAAPSLEASGSATRAVSAQEALAAAALPGATVSTAPGLTLPQAVGLAPALSASSVASTTGAFAVAAAAAPACSANTAWRSWGTWPYEQKLSDTTYWCAVYGSHITYYSSTVNGTGTICGTGWTSSQLIGGGIGYSWFVLRSSAGWSCPTTIPWLSLHPSHYIDISRNAWGSTAEVGSN